jgi:hypothetical protein
LNLKETSIHKEEIFSGCEDMVNTIFTIAIFTFVISFFIIAWWFPKKLLEIWGKEQERSRRNYSLFLPKKFVLFLQPDLSPNNAILIFRAFFSVGLFIVLVIVMSMIVEAIES